MTIHTTISKGFGILVASIATLSFASGAAAQTPERLALADTNGDGNIDWHEVIELRSTTFERLDRNGDGYADSNDSPRFARGRERFNEAFARIEKADRDGDGRVSRSEMLDAPAPLFEKGDVDGDKILSAEELAELRGSIERS
ncbi:MAG: hypothetical protein AAGJ50_10565 [Pseudomonadota bacterium]